MRQITLLLLLFLTNCTANYAADIEFDWFGYPQYNCILQRITSVPLLKKNTELLTIAKMPGGWYLRVFDYSDDEQQLTSTHQIWNSKTKKFISFKGLNERDNGVDGTDDFQTDDFSVHYYENIRYNGYDECEADILEYYANNIYKRSDYDLYSIYKAYSSLSLDLYRYATDEDVALKRDSIYLQYLEYHHKSLSTLQDLIKLNPNFETFVGNVYFKYWNEVMDGYLVLNTEHSYKSALKEIGSEPLYNNFYITYAMQVLGACKPNGILFTHGDGDTYPLLYAQEILGFRKDVLVVNRSLMQLNRYLKALANNKEGSGGTLTLHFPDNGYPEYVSLEDDTVGFVQVPGLKFDSSSTYYYRSDIALYQIIKENNWQRPIHFVPGLTESDVKGLRNYISITGFVATLDTVYHDYFTSLHIDKATGIDWWLNKVNNFDWGTMSHRNAIYPGFATQLRYNGTMLCSHLVSEGDISTAKEIATKVLTLIPNNEVPFDVYMCQLPAIYQKMGEQEKANELSDILFRNAQNTLETLLAERKKSEDWKRKVQSNLFVMQEDLRIMKNENCAEGKVYKSLKKEYYELLEKMDLKNGN